MNRVLVLVQHMKQTWDEEVERCLARLKSAGCRPNFHQMLVILFLLFSAYISPWVPDVQLLPFLTSEPSSTLSLPYTPETTPFEMPFSPVFSRDEQGNHTLNQWVEQLHKETGLSFYYPFRDEESHEHYRYNKTSFDVLLTPGLYLTEVRTLKKETTFFVFAVTTSGNIRVTYLPFSSSFVESFVEVSVRRSRLSDTLQWNAWKTLVRRLSNTPSYVVSMKGFEEGTLTFVSSFSPGKLHSKKDIFSRTKQLIVACVS